MKISKRQLRQIIREEYARLKVRKMLNEGNGECVAYIQTDEIGQQMNYITIVDGEKEIHVHELERMEPNLCRHIRHAIGDYADQAKGRGGARRNADGTPYTAHRMEDLEEKVSDLCNRVCGKPCRIVFGPSPRSQESLQNLRAR